LRNTENNFISIWINFWADRMRLLRELGLMQIDDTGVWIEESVEDAVRRAGFQADMPMPPEVPAQWLRDGNQKSPGPPPAPPPLVNPNPPSPPPAATSSANATSSSALRPVPQGPTLAPPIPTPSGPNPVPPPAPAITPAAYLGAERALKPIVIPDDYAVDKAH
jgi:hypothetical protein